MGLLRGLKALVSPFGGGRVSLVLCVAFPWGGHHSGHPTHPCWAPRLGQVLSVCILLGVQRLIQEVAGQFIPSADLQLIGPRNGRSGTEAREGQKEWMLQFQSHSSVIYLQYNHSKTPHHVYKYMKNVIIYLFRYLDIKIFFHGVEKGTFTAGVEHPLSDAARITRHRIDEHCTDWNTDTNTVTQCLQTGMKLNYSIQPLSGQPSHQPENVRMGGLVLPRWSLSRAGLRTPDESAWLF